MTSPAASLTVSSRGLGGRRMTLNLVLPAKAAAIASLVAAFCSACGAARSDAPVAAQQARPAVTVEVQQVAHRQAANMLRASGLVAFKNETTLSFNAPGQIETMLVDEGDKVVAGQILATLRRTSVGADAAEAEMVRQTAQQTFDRVTRLHASGASSQADLDAARLALERAREIVSISAPANGVILRRDAVRGQVVPAGQGVLQLGEAAAGVIVRASVSSTDVSRVHLDDVVKILVRGREERVGKVTRLSPKMTAGMGTFEIEVRFDDGASLRSGEVAEVLIATNATEVSRSPELFIIPAISLIDARADQAMIYVADADGVARRRAIRTEGITDAGVVVADGLEEGEEVITRGASMVRDGDRISIKKD